MPAAGTTILALDPRGRVGQPWARVACRRE